MRRGRWRWLRRAGWSRWAVCGVGGGGGGLRCLWGGVVGGGGRGLGRGVRGESAFFLFGCLLDGFLMIPLGGFRRLSCRRYVRRSSWYGLYTYPTGSHSTPSVKTTTPKSFAE